MSIINPLELIEKLITEHGSSTILRERLEALRDDVNRLQQKNMDLETELSKIKEEHAKLLEELKKYRKEENFTEKRGALWRMNPDGTYSETPYCVSCKIPMSRFALFPEIIKCARCGYKPHFKFSEIERIIKELPK